MHKEFEKEIHVLWLVPFIFLKSKIGNIWPTGFIWSTDVPPLLTLPLLQEEGGGESNWFLLFRPGRKAKLGPGTVYSKKNIYSQPQKENEGWTLRRGYCAVDINVEKGGSK